MLPHPASVNERTVHRPVTRKTRDDARLLHCIGERVWRTTTTSAMTHIARLLLFSTVLLSPVGSTLAATADEPLGVLVVAHGSTAAAWNTNVEAAVTIIQQHTPSNATYLMGAKNRTPQEAYDDLVAAGVQRIVIVPLLVSSYSSHYEQVRFIGRLRDDYPGSEWMKLTPLHGPADVVGVTPALDAHPILADILSNRARALSRDPSTESLVIVAHGPNGDADADRWMGVIESYQGALMKTSLRRPPTRLST